MLACNVGESSQTGDSRCNGSSDAYEILIGKVLAIVDPTKIALIIFDCHAFLTKRI